MAVTVTMIEVAQRLDVSRQRVWAWHSRRARNGFPASVGHEDRHGRSVAVWSWSAVRRWHAAYEPTDWPRRPRANAARRLSAASRTPAPASGGRRPSGAT